MCQQWVGQKFVTVVCKRDGYYNDLIPTEFLGAGTGKGGGGGGGVGGGVMYYLGTRLTTDRLEERKNYLTMHSTQTYGKGPFR